MYEAAQVTLKWDDPSNWYTKINVGDTVTWITSDGEPHTITSTDNSNELDSNVITSYPFNSFTHTFNKVGYFHYTSKAKPADMVGVIVVSRMFHSSPLISIHLISPLFSDCLYAYFVHLSSIYTFNIRV